jgi:hypothetical protein
VPCVGLCVFCVWIVHMRVPLYSSWSLMFPRSDADRGPQPLRRQVVRRRKWNGCCMHDQNLAGWAGRERGGFSKDMKTG